MIRRADGATKRLDIHRGSLSAFAPECERSESTGRANPRDAAALDEVDAPEPAPGRLRVRVVAAAANLPDVMLCRGTYPLRPDGDFVLGLEAAGVGRRGGRRRRRRVDRASASSASANSRTVRSRRPRSFRPIVRIRSRTT